MVGELWRRKLSIIQSIINNWDNVRAHHIDGHLVYENEFCLFVCVFAIYFVSFKPWSAKHCRRVGSRYIP